MRVAVTDFQALGEVVVAALIAGVGLTAVFSIVIYATTRATELRGGGSGPVTAFLGLVAIVGVAVCLLGIVFAIKVMITK